MYIELNNNKFTLTDYSSGSDVLNLSVSSMYDMSQLYSTIKELIQNGIDIMIYDDTGVMIETLNGYNTIDMFSFRPSFGIYYITLTKYNIANLKEQIEQYKTIIESSTSDITEMKEKVEGTYTDIENTKEQIKDDLVTFKEEMKANKEELQSGINDVSGSIEDIKTSIENIDTNNSSVITVAKISAQSFDDATALSVKNIYDTWEYLCEVNYHAKTAGYKFTHENKLYKTVQDEFTFQSQWIPGQGTSAIFTQITESEDEDGNETGTIDNPIAVPSDVHTNSFTYITGKYYLWNEKIYKCERDNEDDGVEYSFVYDPSQLVGQYFSEVESEAVLPS